MSALQALALIFIVVLTIYALYQSHFDITHPEKGK